MARGDGAENRLSRSREVSQLTAKIGLAKRHLWFLLLLLSLPAALLIGVSVSQWMFPVPDNSLALAAQLRSPAFTAAEEDSGRAREAFVAYANALEDVDVQGVTTELAANKVLAWAMVARFSVQTTERDGALERARAYCNQLGWVDCSDSGLLTLSKDAGVQVSG